MQHESRNISMLMDFYEMTMAHGYFTKLKNVDRVAFDVFFRRNPDKGGFAIFGGLEQIVEYILNLHFDCGASHRCANHRNCSTYYDEPSISYRYKS